MLSRENFDAIRYDNELRQEERTNKALVKLKHWVRNNKNLLPDIKVLKVDDRYPNGRWVDDKMSIVEFIKMNEDFFDVEISQPKKKKGAGRDWNKVDHIIEVGKN